MNKEIENLWNEKEKLSEQIKHIEEKMYLIDKRIEKIQNSCQHLNLKIIKTEINVFEETLSFTIEECKDCGERFYK